MQNLNIEGVANAEKEKQEAEEEQKPEDLLDIREDVKFLIDNSHYQNQEIKGDVLFIHLDDMNNLINDIVETVDKKADNRQ